MAKKHFMAVSMVCLGLIGGAVGADDPVWQFSADSAIVDLLPLSKEGAILQKTSLLAISASAVAYRFDFDGRALGEPVWQVELKERITGVVPIDLGKAEKMLFCDASGSATIVSAATGKVQAARAIASTPLCVLRVTDGSKNGETVFVGCQNGRLYSLSGVTKGLGGGTKFFRDSIPFDSAHGALRDNEEPSGVRSLIAVTDLRGDRACALALVIGRNEVRCISPASFSASSPLRWVFSSIGDVHDLRSTADIDQDGITDCAVACGRDSFYMLSGKTGMVIWQFKTDDSLTCFAAADLDGNGTAAIALGDRQGKVYCLLKDKEETGIKVAWVFDLRDGNAISALADFPAARGKGASGFIVGAQNNRVYLLSFKGKKLWSGETGGTVLSLTALPAGTMDEYPFLAVGDDGGQVTLFHPNGATNW